MVREVQLVSICVFSDYSLKDVVLVIYLRKCLNLNICHWLNMIKFESY